MSIFSDQPLGIIKSIQRGTISFTAASATATITSVDTAKSACRHLGRENGATNAAAIRDADARIELTNATTVTVNSGNPQAGTDIISYEVMEYL